MRLSWSYHGLSWGNHGANCETDGHVANWLTSEPVGPLLRYRALYSEWTKNDQRCRGEPGKWELFQRRWAYTYSRSRAWREEMLAHCRGRLLNQSAVSDVTRSNPSVFTLLLSLRTHTHTHTHAQSLNVAT